MSTDPPIEPQNPPVDNPPTPDPKPKIEFSDEQQREVNRIAAKEAKAAADKTKADTLAEVEAERARVAEAAQRKSDEDKGEFSKVRESLEKERDTITGERDGLKTENDALTTYFTGQYEAALKDLPDVVKAFAPAEDASFVTKSKWLTTAQAEAKKLERKTPRGNGFDPAPSGKALDERQEIQRIRSRIAPL